MKYEGSDSLVRAYKKVLIDEGVTQRYIAEKIGFSRQSINSIYGKAHITFDDMARLLEPLGYEIEFSFIKKA